MLPVRRSYRSIDRRKLLLVGALLAVAAAAVFLSGCSTTERWTTVKSVLASPDEFDTSPVWIAGTVSQAMALPGLGQSVYQVSDDTASVMVLSTNGVPAEGSRVAVQGRAQVGLKVLGKSYAVIFVESDRRTE